MAQKYFEDFEVGDVRHGGRHVVSKDEILRFAREFDPAPFHLDEAAANASVFGGLTASGAHTVALQIKLIHGSHDDNVHPQNTFQLIDALIKNRKQFDLMFYPNKTHGIRGSNEVIHLWTMVFEFMERHLKP